MFNAGWYICWLRAKSVMIRKGKTRNGKKRSELYVKPPKSARPLPASYTLEILSSHQSTLPLPFGSIIKLPATGLQPSSGPLSSPLIKLAMEAV